MAHDLTAIERNPVEGAMGESIDVVPTELLSEKATHTSKTADLGQLARIPKCVWQPKRPTALAKAAFEIALTIQELADERFSAGQIRVVLDPAATDGLEDALLDLRFDAVEELWIDLFQPFELLSLAEDKSMFGIAVH